jgi:hypothetical protein
VDIFTASLRNPLKADVELEHPASLEDAMALACTYEQRLAMPEDSPIRPSLPSRSSTHASSQPKQLLLSAPPSAPNALGGTCGAAPTGPRIKRLTMSEMAAKREHGECYNYTEPFSR